MVDIASIKKQALSFEETIELPHFELTSFRVKNKIFATLDVKRNRACLMLTPVDQSVFTSIGKEAIYPVPNAWGKKGATYVDLKKVGKGIFKDALTTAYCTKAPKNLADKYR